MLWRVYVCVGGVGGEGKLQDPINSYTSVNEIAMQFTKDTLFVIISDIWQFLVAFNIIRMDLFSLATYSLFPSYLSSVFSSIQRTDQAHTYTHLSDFL